VGLLSALRWYLGGLTQRSGIETKLEVSPKDFPRLALELETAMFRIVQEALTNVFRHSGARQAWISLTQQEGTVTVKVRDNGKGVADGTVGSRSSSPGVGIRGMSERAKELGGQLLVTSAHPGTIVEVTIPVSVSVSPALPRPEEKLTVLGTNNDPVGQATVG
jgi:signal transduction histidine kinase